MWLSQNDIIFNKISIQSYVEVIFKGTHCARTWAPFQKEEDQTVLQAACRLIETMTMDIFIKHVW
jgi:hypothetical protein